jgi:threonine dehydratase
MPGLAPPPPPLSGTLPITLASVQSAHTRIKPLIHRTPVQTSTTLNTIASAPQSPSALIGTPFEGQTPAHPKLNFFFKCENYQRIGAFKARGAFHALSRLTDTELKNGVCTHSSGNHAAALALAARTRGVKAYIVMPSISAPSKIAATKSYGAEIIFSGSTSQEREAKVAEVIAETGARLVPPYDYADIILGQGTAGLELQGQVRDMVAANPELSVHSSAKKMQNGGVENGDIEGRKGEEGGEGQLDAVLAPLGGGGLLSGLATAFSESSTRVFGAEPSFQGANDAQRGLSATPPTRITSVKTLTIADGLRTPVGAIPWSIISDKNKVEGVYSVSEEQIKKAIRLVVERMKVFVEPSAVVGLAVALFDEGFRGVVEREGGKEGWDVGIVFSGGNTTIEAIGKLFAEDVEREQEGKVGNEGKEVNGVK